jgi:predicted nucleic acid-binding Zn ribbon protein
MPKLVEYECENGCDFKYEELFSDTETQPQVLEQKCEKCGGSLKRAMNLKSNCQVWGVNKM